MNIETVLIMYRNLINYEVTRVLHENVDLWDEAIHESFIRINGSLESILTCFWGVKCRICQYSFTACKYNFTAEQCGE